MRFHGATQVAPQQESNDEQNKTNPYHHPASPNSDHG